MSLSSEEFAKRLVHSNINTDFIFSLMYELGYSEGNRKSNDKPNTYVIYAEKCENKVYIMMSPLIGYDYDVEDNKSIIFKGNNVNTYEFLLNTAKNM